MLPTTNNLPFYCQREYFVKRPNTISNLKSEVKELKKKHKLDNRFLNDQEFMYYKRDRECTS